MKFERGYIDPMIRKPKNQASISIRVPEDDREILDKYLSCINKTKSEWGRSLVKKELQAIKMELVNNNSFEEPKYTLNTMYTNEKYGFFRKIIAFVNFLETQKKPDIAGRAFRGVH